MSTAVLEAAAPRVGCRLFERHSCSMQTSCKPTGANETRWEATIRDISRGGILLSLSRRFERGACLAIDLPGRQGELPYTALVRVARLQPEENGTWAHGCRIVGELAEDEVTRLVQLFAVPPRPAKPTVENVRLRLETPTGRPRFFRIRRFHVPGTWPLEPGTTISLKGLPIPGARDQFRVLHCDRLDNGWEIEIESVETFPGSSW
jgi:PilZ domain